MTITDWHCFDNLASEHGFVFPKGEDGEVPEGVDTYENIQTVSNDIMVQVRRMHPREYLDKNGELKRESTFKTLMNFFGYITDILEKTDVVRYAVCFDPFNKEFNAKLEARKHRVSIPKNEPERLEKPPGQETFFEMKKPFPAPNVNIIFRTFEAKREFYHIVTIFLKCETFRMRIPESKCVILCGGYDMTENVNLPPLIITRHDVTIRHDLDFPSCKEADLYAIWLVRHFSGNFIVKSGDADLLFILLLAMEEILKLNPNRKCWFVTPRGAGTVERDIVGQELQLLHHKNQIYEQALETGAEEKDLFLSVGTLPSLKSLKVKRHCTEASSPSASSSVPSLVISSRQWVRRYVDMVEFFNAVHREATAHHIHHNFKIFSPIENFVAIFLLSGKSHDFINLKDFAKGIGNQIIWQTAMAHQKELAELVKIGYDPDRITGKTTKYITVDTVVTRAFVILCHRRLADTRKNPAVAYENSIKKLPPIEVTQAIAGQLAWTLHYWSMGFIRSARIEDELLVYPGTDLSVYGMDALGRTDKVHLSEQKTCPFFVAN